MAETYTVVCNKMDVSFNPSECHEYGISMVFSETELSFAIADLRRSKFIGLQSLVRNDAGNGHIPGQEKHPFPLFFREVMENLPYLKSGFKIHRIAFMSDRQTLIPGTLYEPAGHEHYLSVLFGIKSDEHIFSDSVESMDAYQVFSMPEVIYKAVDSHLDRRRIFCHATVFIQSIFVNYSRQHHTKVFINIRTGNLDILVYNGRQVQYFNSFRQQCPDDIVYFLIFIMEQLNLNPEQVPVVVLGETSDDGHLEELIFTYVRHVEFGKRGNFFKFSHVLDDIPAHSRFVLFNFLSCGL